MNQYQVIHQIAPVFAYGDAIGNQMYRMRESLRKLGYASQVYAPARDLRIADAGEPLTRYPSAPHNVLIYHYSTHTPLSDFVLGLPDKVIFYYHNVTPPDFFAPYDPDFAEKLRRGRQDISRFTHCFKAWAVSDYNAQDMRRSGFGNITIMPLFIYVDELLTAAQTNEARKIIEQYDDGWVNWLFVGRLAPNKRQDDIIRAFAYYHRVINPRSRLFLVGSDGGLPVYRFELETLAARISEHIYLPGSVSFEALAGYYRVASVFVSMSEHEGFGIPLVEAMSFDIPVVAYKAAAIPNTLGNAGVLINAKRYDLIAELVDVLVKDKSIRQRIIQGQRSRLQQLSPQVTEMKLRQAIQALNS